MAYTMYYLDSGSLISYVAEPLHKALNVHSANVIVCVSQWGI